MSPCHHIPFNKVRISLGATSRSMLRKLWISRKSRLGSKKGRGRLGEVVTVRGNRYIKVAEKVSADQRTPVGIWATIHPKPTRTQPLRPKKDRPGAGNHLKSYWTDKPEDISLNRNETSLETCPRHQVQSFVLALFQQLGESYFHHHFREVEPVRYEAKFHKPSVHHCSRSAAKAAFEHLEIC